MTELFNPFTGETTEVSKAGYGGAGYPDALKGTPMIGKTRQVGSLVPTGKHVSHENDLHVIRRGKRKNVGRYGETKLEVYRGGGKGSTKLLTVKKSDELGDLSRQPGMINPGVVTSSWSHGTPNQNFAAQSGRRGRKIS